MDRAWMTCDQSALADFFDELEAAIGGISAAFVYDVDESGWSKWADKPTEMIILVSTDLEKDRILAPIGRHSKRSTTVGCIAGTEA